MHSALLYHALLNSALLNHSLLNHMQCELLDLFEDGVIVCAEDVSRHKVMFGDGVIVIQHNVLFEGCGIVSRHNSLRADQGSCAQV